MHCAGCLQLSLPTADGIPMHMGVHPRALSPKVGCPAMPLGGWNYSSRYQPDLGEVGRWHHLHLAGMWAEKCCRFKNRFGLLILGGRSGERHICVCWERGRAGAAPTGLHWFCSQGHPRGVSLCRGKGRSVGPCCLCLPCCDQSFWGADAQGAPMFRLLPQFYSVPMMVPRAGQGPQAGVTPSPIAVQGTDKEPQAGGHPVLRSSARGNSRSGG